MNLWITGRCTWSVPGRIPSGAGAGKDYLAVGINGLAPCEVAAGMDPVELRRTFGKSLRLLGGFDKRLVAQGKAAIDAEFRRLQPVINEGGYLPAIDHSVSADIAWDNYRHFIDAVRKASGQIS